MELFEIDSENQLRLKEKYEALVSGAVQGWCLVSLALKNFLEYSRFIGHEESEKAIRACFDILADCLSEEEDIVRIHSCYFNLLVKCEPNVDALHPRAHAFHFAVRDAMQARYERPLYLEMGFSPVAGAENDFYEVLYQADLSRLAPHNLYPETNYDMYGVSFRNPTETFAALEDMVEPALARGDFKLYLQPKVDLRTGEVIAAEALMRWIDPKRGMIPLSDFLPGIEENGSARDVDRYLFDKGCAYLEKWYREHGKRMQISFNMCRAYFNGIFFLPEYSETFHKYDIPPDSIRIELLESVVLNDLDRLKPLVEGIYDLGFSCALDDFGSGFSSFDVLTNVKLSELKIDRSLFQNIENEKERILIAHIVEIAHSMDMVAVAEGVETEDYANFLKEIGCDFIQGFLYYRPMPVEEFEKRFIANK